MKSVLFLSILLLSISCIAQKKYRLRPMDIATIESKNDSIVELANQIFTVIDVEKKIAKRYKINLNDVQYLTYFLDDTVSSIIIKQSTSIVISMFISNEGDTIYKKAVRNLSDLEKYLLSLKYVQLKKLNLEDSLNEALNKLEYRFAFFPRLVECKIYAISISTNDTHMPFGKDFEILFKKKKLIKCVDSHKLEEIRFRLEDPKIKMVDYLMVLDMEPLIFATDIVVFRLHQHIENPGFFRYHSKFNKRVSRYDVRSNKITIE